MSPFRFQNLVRDREELRGLIGQPSELVIKKQLSELDAHMRAFVARAPLLLLGTFGDDGRCDVSPRGDLPAAVSALDSKTLVIAERPGNRRADSLQNILATGRVGLLLLVPGVGETLRINGRGCLFRDSHVLASLAAHGKPPSLAIGVEVEECYFQCAKALIRSKLWGSMSTAACCDSFNLAQILVEQTGIPGQTAEVLREQIEASYRDRLY